jgi:uncharacterized phiE125 gp8 family phage protein
MGVGTYALTSLAKLKSYLNISATTWDTFLESCVDAATGQAELYTNRKLKGRAYSYLTDADSDDAIIDGNGLDRIQAPQYPINSVTTLRIDTSEIDARGSVFNRGYVLDKNAGIIHLAGYLFTEGLRNIELVYTAGFSTVPDDLEQAVIEQAAWVYKESGVGGSLLGVTGKQLPDGSLSFMARDLLPGVKMVLDKYRKRFAL